MAGSWQVGMRDKRRMKRGRKKERNGDKKREGDIERGRETVRQRERERECTTALVFKMCVGMDVCVLHKIIHTLYRYMCVQKVDKPSSSCRYTYMYTCMSIEDNA